MGKYYKVKHENVIGRNEIEINDEELTELINKHLELNGINKGFEDFETEKEFYTWYENTNDELLIKIEKGTSLDCGDYEIVYR